MQLNSKPNNNLLTQRSKVVNLIVDLALCSIPAAPETEEHPYTMPTLYQYHDTDNNKYIYLKLTCKPCSLFQQMSSTFCPSLLLFLYLYHAHTVHGNALQQIQE